MKKIAVAMLVALAGMGMALAQNFKLEWKANNHVITEGETVVFESYVEEIDMDAMAFFMQVTNTSSEKMSFTGTIAWEKQPENSLLAICGFGGCRAGFEIDGELEAGATSGDNERDPFDITYTPNGSYDTAIVACTFNDGKGGSLNFKIMFIPSSRPVANENLELAGVSVYPNPSNGIFNLDVPERAQVEIFAVNGQLVKQMEVMAGKTSVQINRTGVYFMRVRANGKTAVRRIVIG